MKAAREEKVPKYGSEEENSEGDVIDGVEQKAVSAPKDGQDNVLCCLRAAQNQGSSPDIFQRNGAQY